MNLVTHHAVQDGIHGVSRAMAGVELRPGTGLRQSAGQLRKFVFALMIVEQVEPSYNAVHGERTCCKDVLQTAVGAAREQQTVCIQRQFVTEVIPHTAAVGFLCEEVPVALRHRVDLGYVCHDVDVVADASAVFHRQQSLRWHLRPRCRDAVQALSPGVELSFEGIGRDDDFCLVVHLHEMLQSSRMVAVSVGDEHVVHRAEIDARSLRITDKDITCSCVKQNPMMLRF